MIRQNRFLTLQQLLKKIDENFDIEEIPDEVNRDVDRLTYLYNGEKKFVCAVPKQGKKLTWPEMIAERRDKSKMTSGDIGQPVLHRALDGLMLVLYSKGLIRWDEVKEELFGHNDFTKRVDKEILKAYNETGAPSCGVRATTQASPDNK